jgi:hypothetical protein
LVVSIKTLEEFVGFISRTGKELMVLRAII